MSYIPAEADGVQMRMYNGKNTIKEQIRKRISSSKKRIFSPKDFADVSSYPQVLRALKQLTNEEKIIRLGQGVYAKAGRNPFNGGVYPKGSKLDLCIEILRKFNVKYAFSKSVNDYNAGISGQIPFRNQIVLKSRFSRKIDTLKDIYAK
jgi:hypothetical protein